MLIKTQGIVFRSVKYSETSLILDIFTRDYGLKTYIISGVRQNKSRSGAALYQIGSVLDIEAYEKENSKINRLKEAKIAYFYSTLYFEIKKFSIALFLIELLSKVIKEKEKNKPVYSQILNALIYLDSTHNRTSNYHLCFMAKAVSSLGFEIQSNFTTINNIFDIREGKFIDKYPTHKDYLEANDAKMFSDILNTMPENSYTLILPSGKNKEFLTVLISYYEYHIGNIGNLKTMEVFGHIFSRL